MLDITGQTRRPRGRPQIRPDDETRKLIVAAAAEQFRLRGYSQANINTVAQRAGVSTKTLYRLIPTKADLFEMFMAERISTFMLEVDHVALEALDLEEALHRILVAYGRLALSPDVITVYRLVIAEADRFPEMAATYHHYAIARINNSFADQLALEAGRGRLHVRDALEAASMLRGMMVMDPQRAALLGETDALQSRQIEARATACVRLFLDGMRRPPDDGSQPQARTGPVRQRKPKARQRCLHRS